MVSNLSRDLADRYNIKIAIFDTSEASYPFRGELLRIRLPFSGNPAENTFWARTIRLILLVYKLRALKKRHRIDVAISLGEQANIVNVLAGGAKKNVVSVRTLLSNQILEFNHARILTWLVKRLYNKAYRVVVPSRLAAQDLTRNFNVRPEKLLVIYNYLDEERVGRLSDEPIEDPFLRRLFEYPVLLNVGRIARAKGQWLLPVLFSRLKRSSPGWKLVILGEPEEGGIARQRLLELAAESGLSVYDTFGTDTPQAGGNGASADHLQHDIFLIGFRKNPWQFMKRSRILWFPSTIEGFPNIIIEAMRCGLPVITADCHSGPREILSPETDPFFTTDKAEITPYGILEPPLKGDMLAPIDEQLVDEWVNSTQLLIREETRRSEFITNGYRRLRDFTKESALAGWEGIVNG